MDRGGSSPLWDLGVLLLWECACLSAVPASLECRTAQGQPEPEAGPSDAERVEDMSAADMYCVHNGRIRKLAKGRQEDVSKALTNLLRHSTEKAGLSISSDGFVSATALMKTKRFQRERISMDDIVAAVTFNDKARFELAHKQVEPSYTQEGPPGKSLHVRAVQGHSIRKVDNEAVLTKLGEHELPKIAVHGTYWDFYHSILDRGLLAGGPSFCGRHIHFTTE